jgi:hypothetical protein
VAGLGTVWILDGIEVTIVGAIASRLQEDEVPESTGRRELAGTYFVSAVGFPALGLLLNADILGLGGFMVVLCATFFVASAAASAGYLTVSEVFPRWRRGPWPSRSSTRPPPGSGGRSARPSSAPSGHGRSREPLPGLLPGRGAHAHRRRGGGLLGVDVERESLENVAEPLSATDGGAA